MQMFWGIVFVALGVARGQLPASEENLKKFTVECEVFGSLIKWTKLQKRSSLIDSMVNTQLEPNSWPLLTKYEEVNTVDTNLQTTFSTAADAFNLNVAAPDAVNTYNAAKTAFETGYDQKLAKITAFIKNLTLYRVAYDGGDNKINKLFIQNSLNEYDQQLKNMKSFVVAAFNYHPQHDAARDTFVALVDQALVHVTAALLEVDKEIESAEKFVVLTKKFFTAVDNYEKIGAALKGWLDTTKNVHAAIGGYDAHSARITAIEPLFSSTTGLEGALDGTFPKHFVANTWLYAEANARNIINDTFSLIKQSTTEAITALQAEPMMATKDVTAFTTVTNETTAAISLFKQNIMTLLDSDVIQDDARNAHAAALEALTTSIKALATSFDATSLPILSGAEKDKQAHIYLMTTKWDSQIYKYVMDTISRIVNLRGFDFGKYTDTAVPAAYTKVVTAVTNASRRVNGFYDIIANYNPETSPGKPSNLLEFMSSDVKMAIQQMKDLNTALLQTYVGHPPPLEDQTKTVDCLDIMLSFTLYNKISPPLNETASASVDAPKNLTDPSGDSFILPTMLFTTASILLMV